MVHWTKKREAKDRIQIAESIGFRSGIDSLISYLESEKFYQDTTVQVRDVLNRIASAKETAEYLRADQERIEKENGNLS